MCCYVIIVQHNNNHLSARGDGHVWVGQDELSNGGIKHKTVDLIVESDDPG